MYFGYGSTETNKNIMQRFNLVSGFKHEFYFPFHIWVVIPPIDFHSFQDGHITTNQVPWKFPLDPIKPPLNAIKPPLNHHERNGFIGFQWARHWGLGLILLAWHQPALDAFVNTVTLGRRRSAAGWNTSGVSINGGTPIAGWFISWKIHENPSINGWMISG